MMETKATAIEELFEKAKQFGKTSLELYKLKAIDVSVELISSMLSRMVIYLTVAFFILMLAIGSALCIGEELGKTYYGFFVIAGCFVMLAVLLNFTCIKLIKRYYGNTILSQILKQKS